MEVNLTPELEKKLADLAALSGRPADELVRDAVAGLVGHPTGASGGPPELDYSREDCEAVLRSEEYFQQGGRAIPFEEFVAECGFTMDDMRGRERSRLETDRHAAFSAC